MEQAHEAVKGVFYTMEQINMTKYLPCTTRLVGGTLYILDGEGRVQRRLDPLQTAIEWFQMSNDAFYARYGVGPEGAVLFAGAPDGTFGRWPPCVKLSGAMPRP